jgi:hypothetical protein
MHDDGVTGQVLSTIGPEVAMFTFEPFDSPSVVDTLVNAQVVLVGEFSPTHWTLIGSLIGRQVCGEMIGEGCLADSDVGAKMAYMGAGDVV